MSSGDLGKVYEDGELIIRQGEAGNCMYVVQEGKVEVYVEREGKEVQLGTRGEGEIIGEMAIFERQERFANVRACGRARVLTVDKKNFLGRVHEDPSIAFRVIKTMSSRIRELSNEIARLKGQKQAE